MSVVHVLRLAAGELRVRITEAPDAIFIAIDGAKLGADDEPALVAFLAPIIDRFRDDPRRMEISGAHADYTGHVVPAAGGAWVGFAVPNEGRQ